VAVEVVTTPGADYLWNGSPFAWDSAEGGKTWADASATSFVATENDGLILSALEAWLPLAVRADAFVVGDARQQTAIAVCADVLAMAETYIDLIAFVLKVAESFAIAEAAPKQILPTPAFEAFGIGGAADRRLLRIVAELLEIIDVRVGAAQRVSQESVSLADQSERFAVKPSLSSLGLTDERRAIVQPDLHQSLTLSETYSDLIGFIVQIAEALSIVDRVSAAAVHLNPEQLEVLDRVLRASEAVIADLAFRSTPLDAEGFAALVAESRPLGYSPFRDLTPGDYEYARALLRLALEGPSTTGSRVALADARLNIDVPDVRDRGTVSVPIGGTVVPFARSFNAPPEVQATFKGGGVLAVPQIGTITTTGFQLSLINPDTLASVAGNASWSAEGY